MRETYSGEGQRKHINQGILQLAVAMILMFISIATPIIRGFPQQCNEIHVGDLVISGNEVFRIEGKVYCQTGNVYVRDNAKLIIENGTIIFNQSFNRQYGFTLTNQASFEMQNSTITPTYYTDLFLCDSSKAYLQNSDLSRLFTTTSGNALLDVSDNSELDQLGIADSVTFIARDSYINAIHLGPSSRDMHLSGLIPGYFEDWRFPDPYYDICLIRSTVGNWGLWISGSATVVLDESCEIGQLGVEDQAKVTIRDSDVAAPVLLFKENQTIQLTDLHKGYIETWWFRDPSTGQELTIERTTITRDWEVNVSGATLNISNSALGRLSSGSGTSIGKITLENSSITGELWLEQEFGGHVHFVDAVIAALVSPSSLGSAKLSGSVDFVREQVDPRLTNPWFNSTIMREFPIIVQDLPTSPLANVVLELYDPDGNLIWQEPTDSEGKASFEIVFDDNNYDKTWTLRAPDLDTSIGVRLLIDTPIRFYCHDYVKPRWWMISFPFIPDPTGPESQLGDDIDLSFFCTWDPLLKEYIYPTELLIGQGYWSKFDGGMAVDLTGHEFAAFPQTITCAAPGWHMIGPAYTTCWGEVQVVRGDETLTIAQAAARGWIKPFVIRYDPTISPDYYYWVGYEEAILTPWEGYWFMTLVPGVALQFPHAPTSPASVLALDRPRALGFRPVEAGMELPPVPPQLSSPASQVQVVLAPNPVTGESASFRVRGICPCSVQSLQVAIYDLAGELVWQGESRAPTLPWHAEDQDGLPLANGIYLFKASVLVGGNWLRTDLQAFLILR